MIINCKIQNLMYTLGFNEICVNLYAIVLASARMKFASKARLRFVFPFGNIEPTYMPLSGHFMDIKGRVLMYQTGKYQLTNEVCIRS